MDSGIGSREVSVIFWDSQTSLTVSEWAIRGMLAYFWLLFLTKLMGQREVGRLTLFDFTTAIAMGGIIAGSLNNPRAGLVGSFTATGVFASLNILLAVISLRFPKFRRVVHEEPIVLVRNGVILEDTMEKARITLNDLSSALRLKDIPNLSHVEVAILEPNGRISVIPKSQFRPVTARDLDLPTGYEGLPISLIEDGNILTGNLEENHLSTDWLYGQLQSMGIAEPDRVMAATLDTEGLLYVSMKGQTKGYTR